MKFRTILLISLGAAISCAALSCSGGSGTASESAGVSGPAAISGSAATDGAPEAGQATCAASSCYCVFEGDTLVMGNSLIERHFVWNGGNLMTWSVSDKANGKVHKMQTLQPDFVMSSPAAAENGLCSYETMPETPISPEYLKVTVSYTTGSLNVVREYRIYEGVPAIACDTRLNGSLSGTFSSAVENNADKKNIEFAADMASRPVSAVIDRISLAGKHWHARAVEFWDVTDWNDNLVTEREIISYRKNSYRGNILFMSSGEDGSGLFFLKEAPCSSTQTEYTGADFIAEYGNFSVTGPGIATKDISPDSWTSIYSCVLGVAGPGELQRLTALRLYQKNVRRHIPERDEMIMMNTWGDRSQDTKVNESFCLAELEKAARLGVTHFQIDDGWQVGKSPNSALAKGSFKNIWDNPDYWTPDPVKYPHGLTPIVDRARELGIEIGLWFNPSIQNNFADWAKDAQAIIRLWKEYGIRVYKIDGLNIPNKEAEKNLRSFFDTVLQETDNQVVFNLDATAGRRGGYHSFNEYGNIFLENRYTDWGNYYPYRTLRNLWTLSRYVPAEKLQIEFLNNWRNPDQYPDDPFAPGNYSFEYLFATAIAGQPLAWMEASNLPDEAYSIASTIQSYKKIQNDFHSGIILPVGEEPSGRSWTGFQSITGDGIGYLLIYREANDDKSAFVGTWLEEGSKVTFEKVLGHGKGFRTKVGRGGEIPVSLPSPNSFVLYEYRVVQ